MKSKVFFLDSYLKYEKNLLNFFVFFRREKEESVENNQDEDDDTVKNGFVPIGQAVKNAEVRSAAATSTINDET